MIERSPRLLSLARAAVVAGLPRAFVAVTCGLDGVAMRQAAYGLNLTAAEVAGIAAALRDGAAISAVARQFCVGRNAVRAIANREGIVPRRIARRIIPPDMRAAIAVDAGSGERTADIARRWRISAPTVRNIHREAGASHV